MPKKERIIRYKAAPAGAVGTRATVVSSPVDHGSLQGLGDDDHTQYAALAQAETVSGAWTFSDDITLDSATIDGITPSDHSARHDPDGADELTTAAPSADSVNLAASGAGTATSLSRSDHTHNLDESIVPTWIGAHLFQATMTTRDLLPEATDTYDIGSSTYWYSQQFVSQINAAVFAEEQIMLLGGWLYVSHDAGVFDAEVGSGDSTIDFGKTMTPNDFVLVKAYAKGSTIKTEYIQILTQVAGNVYNVTRDLATAHGTDPVWAAGTPFAVLGQTDDGRIELNAYEATIGPRIQFIVQDDAVTYSNTTEYVRIGDMKDSFGSDAAGEWGLGVGDYSGGNYMAYNTTDGFEMKVGGGNIIMDSSGIEIDTPGAAADGQSFKFTSSGSTASGLYAYLSVPITTNLALLHAKPWTSYSTAALIKAEATTSETGYIFLDADSDAGNATFALYSDGSSSNWAELGAHPMFINDDANTDMTIGLTINQGDNDDEALALKSSDVAHGMTDFAETDSYFTISKQNADAGGALLTGYRDADGGPYAALQLYGALGEAADTTKTTGGYGVVHISSVVKSGTGFTTVGADGNLVSIANYGTTRFLFDAEGSAHADVEWVAFDDQDDLTLLDTLESSLTSWQGDGVKEEFGHWLADNQHELERLKLVTFDRDNPGHVMVNTTRLLMLLTGACRQLGQRLEVAERALLTA